MRLLPLLLVLLLPGVAGACYECDKNPGLMSMDEYHKKHPDQLEAPPICRTAPMGRDCVRCDGWATKEDIEEKGYLPGSHPGMTWTPEWQKKVDSEEVDRFLAEKVDGHIREGNSDLQVSPGVATQRAIAHFLAALVEIEKEKLRRDSR